MHVLKTGLAPANFICNYQASAVFRVDAGQSYRIWTEKRLLSRTESIRRHSVPKELLLKAKQDGFSDRQIGQILGSSEGVARELRLGHNIKPWVKQVSRTRSFFYFFQIFWRILYMDVNPQRTWRVPHVWIPRSKLILVLEINNDGLALSDLATHCHFCLFLDWHPGSRISSHDQLLVLHLSWSGKWSLPPVKEEKFLCNFG